MEWRTVRYDAIVVGSGAAGGMAAKCLTDGGASVLLLEAGPAMPAEVCRERERLPKEFAAMRVRQPVQSRSLLYNRRNCHLYVDDLDNPYSTDAATEFNWIRSRQAGGRTLIWSRYALRMSDEDFASPNRDGIGIPWPITYRDLTAYYDKAEALMDVCGTSEGLPSLPDGCFLPRRVPSYFHTVREQIEQRFPERHLIPSKEVTEDTKPTKSKPPSHASLGSTIFTCDRRKLTFRTNCVVARVELDRPNHARGVVFVDRETTKWCEVLGRVIVLCASTIESTRILLASLSREFPTGLGNSSGALGHYLMDHFGGSRLVAIGRLKDAEPKSRARAYLPRFCNSEYQSEDFVRGYGIQGEFEVADGGAASFTMGVFGEVLPYFENSVELDRSVKDVCGFPVPRIHFQYRENEHRMALHAQTAAREVVHAMGFRPLVIDDEMLAPGTRSHELGTARMGTSPKNSVLNSFNQCWDVDNLFVTDGSCFPSAGYKGPTLTIMALTARTCDYILSLFRCGAL